MINLNFKTVFVDIDTTLTDPKPEFICTDSTDPFILLVAKVNDVSIAEAREMIFSELDAVGDLTKKIYPFGMLGKLNVTDDELWQIFAKKAEEDLFMHDDAKCFLMGLRETRPDVKVFTATTNPQLIIYSKLAIVGLADKNGSPYLDGAFGGEEVYPGGKLYPEFYTALLERTGADPKTTLMVGDSPEFDLALAKAAGIDQVVLVRRDQDEDFVMEDDGGIYLKRLDTILI